MIKMEFTEDEINALYHEFMGSCINILEWSVEKWLLFHQRLIPRNKRLWRL